MYCDQPRKIKDALQPFVALQAQVQVPMQERIFGAVERLRGRMGNPAHGAPLTPNAAAALRRLEVALLGHNPTVALNAYRDMLPGDTRSDADIDRDLKDLGKLTRNLQSAGHNSASIHSLSDIVASPNIAAIRRATIRLARGNSPQEAAERLVGSAVEKLRELSREALTMNAARRSASQGTPPPSRQGTKRRATVEVGESSAAAARRRVEPAVPTELTPAQVALDKALHEELAAILTSGEPPPRLP